MSTIDFDQLGLDGDPNPSRVPSKEKAKKFKEAVTNGQFLSSLGVTTINRADEMTVTMSAGKRRIILHMDGSFHMASRRVPLEEVVEMERCARAILKVAVKVLGVKSFDLDFDLHHFFQDKEKIMRMLSILASVRSKLVLEEIGGFEARYLLLGIGPALELGFGEDGHFDIYYEPKSISLGNMKEKYLLEHVKHGVAVALKQLR